MSAADFSTWPCLTAARAHDAAARMPFAVATPDGGLQRAGSVARADLPALAPWADVLHEQDGQLRLLASPDERNALLGEVNAALRAQGLIRAWRDEPYPLLAAGSGELLAVIERAASRFWGALTFGAHCNGYVADADGRPVQLWIARRAWNKPTDPGRLDNLIGGGVPHGQTPREALLREAWEEAGLQPAQMAGLHAGSVLELFSDIPEGLQHEWLYVHDLALPAGLVPQNQDGEVAEHRLMPVAQALAEAASGAMTVDAALATLDFALRHRLLPGDEGLALAGRLDRLRVPHAAAARFNLPRP
jgi:8-oxo-dGTP pyrophosphatase MutT (NUDIX family)